MIEQERKTMERLSEIVPGLPESKKERLLGIAEGMAIMKEVEEKKREATGQYDHCGSEAKKDAMSKMR